MHNGQNDQNVIRIEGAIPVDIPIANNKKFLFISKDQRALTHGIHKYPAKFFPELPRWVIERFSRKGDLVLDPFMGSGTTNLEASLSGRNSIGVDVDPFSRLLSSVKTTPLSLKALENAYNDLVERMHEYNENAVTVYEIPTFPYRENWFKPYILKELSYIKHCINSLQTSKKITDFFLICFSSLVRSVSEADNNCTRTVIRKKLNKQVKRGMAIELFLKKLHSNLTGMRSLIEARPEGKVIIPENMDARNMSGIDDDQIDLSLTSPPYMNAVDYPRTHQLELYWLGLAEGSLREMKKQHIGTEVVTADKYKKLHLTGISSADNIIAKIYSVDNRRAYIASKYITDMTANLKEIHRVLKPGAYYVMVVGNNTVRGENFETWRYMRDAAPECGYTVVCNFVSAIINHFIKVPRPERINDDHVLVMQKCK
ncbi:MAG: DNA methyltransferase [Salinispira sp.]